MEITLWRHLFTAVGDPKELFQQSLTKKQFSTAASYLIILQNLETSAVSRLHATILLDAALDHGKWELAKDLVRFLRAIDPNDVETPPRSTIGSASKYSLTAHHPTSPITPSDEDLSFVLGSTQVPRMRTPSLSSSVKVPHSDSATHQTKPIPIKRKTSVKDGTAEEFFIDVILQRHTRKLLSSCRLRDLGSFAAFLDIHLVTWLKRERNRAAKIEDFVATLKRLHQDFQWPYPICPLNVTVRRSDSSNEAPSPVDVPCRTFQPREQIGDSGYHGSSGPRYEASLSSYDQMCSSSSSNINNNNNNDAMEAKLRPHVVIEDEESSHTVELSEDSSVWGDSELPSLDEASWDGLQLGRNLEHLTQEVANKGPQQSEVQLRYLLQLMMEAGCLDYSLLISIVLRDAMAVMRTINACRVFDQGQEAAVRLREALVSIEQWTSKECLGYRLFMHAIRNQLTVLNNIIWSKPRTSSASTVDSSTNDDQCPCIQTVSPQSPSLPAQSDGNEGTDESCRSDSRLSVNEDATSATADHSQISTNSSPLAAATSATAASSRAECAIS